MNKGDAGAARQRTVWHKPVLTQAKRPAACNTAAIRGDHNPRLQTGNAQETTMNVVLETLVVVMQLASVGVLAYGCALSLGAGTWRMNEVAAPRRNRRAPAHQYAAA